LVPNFKLEARGCWKQDIPAAENKQHQHRSTSSYDLPGTSLYFHMDREKLKNRTWNKNLMMHLIPNVILNDDLDCRTWA